LGSAVFEWLSHKRHIDYPFTKQRDDDLHTLLVDAYVYHTQYRDKEQLLRVYKLSPSAGVVELRFEDGTVLAALTSSDNFHSSVFGSYTVFEWIKSTDAGAGLTGEDLVVRLSAVTERLGDYAWPLWPTDAYLQPSLVHQAIDRVRRIGVALRGAACCLAVTDKPVILEAGYNMLLEPAEDQPDFGLNLDDTVDVREPATIVFNADAGEGEGTYPTCLSLSSAIRTVNGVGTDDIGNFQLDMTDCLWPEMRISGSNPPVNQNTDYLSQLQEALLHLHANCKACCRCQDYGSVYSQLAGTWARAQNVSERYRDLVARYNTQRSAFSASKASAEVLSLRVRALAQAGFNVGITALVANNTGSTKTELVLRLTLSDSSTYIDGTGLMDSEEVQGEKVDPTGSGTTYEVILPRIASTKWARYQVGFRVDTNGARVGKAYSVTGLLVGEGVSDIKTTELKGPLELT
jgi:hypothetical protein